MTNSVFDPDTFMNMEFDEANSTKRVPVPAGEYTGVISKIECRKWAKKDDPSVTGYTLDVSYEIDDANLKEFLKRDKAPVVRQNIMLDMTVQGTLDFSEGRNIQLGRLRKATNTNTKGEKFRFGMLEGKVVKISVGHRPSTAPGAEPGDVFEEVKSVATV